VGEYPPVSGMRKCLFWLDHRHHEAESDEHQIISTSHSSDYEVGVAVALAKHLISQGVYESNEIAVDTLPRSTAEAQASAWQCLRCHNQQS